MRRKLPVCIILLACAAVSFGCASKIYVGPSSGRSAENQLLISRAADEAFKDLDLGEFKGKNVHLAVYGLAAKASAQGPEEAFIANHLVERLGKARARIVQRREDADIVLTVSLRIAGVDIVRRDFYYTYRHTTIRGVVEARIVGYDNKSGEIVFTRDALGVVVSRERYLFYIIGPYRSIWTMTKKEWLEDIGDEPEQCPE
ncbi:MAG: hypothetical protein ACYS8W_00130 [Planctomycetota bacterium]|jgi:hypothetical protein